MARVLLRYSRDDLAKKVRIPTRTLTELEHGGRRSDDALAVVEAFLTESGITFDDDGVNVRLDTSRKRGKR